MCGISGIISKKKSIHQDLLVKKMTDAIIHRGPDGEGFFTDPEKGISLGHRRLAIIDLSTQANQPMYFEDKYIIVYNGEIYNYIELKNFLLSKGYTFKTSSDTEVLLATYDYYGIDFLSQLEGMFAFALYDKGKNKIIFARDRFGEKPFFYSYKEGEYFYFGSEMKCLWAAGIPKEINQKLLYNYLNQGVLENPFDPSETFYTHCRRLGVSSYLELDLEKISISHKVYYQITRDVNHSIKEEDAIAQFRDLMITSVKRMSRSDVPVGSSLSGGLDSSLIVSIMHEYLKDSLKEQHTFSAVFPGYKKNEKKYIDTVLEGKDIQAHFVTPNDVDLFNDLEKLFHHQEEPFLSSSIYAQYCVMGTAKKNNIKVLLDGQGADEILAGYHAYYHTFFKELAKNNRSLYQHEVSTYKKLHENNSINGLVKPTIGDRVRNVHPKIFLPIKKLSILASEMTDPSLNRDFRIENMKSLYYTYGNSFEDLNDHLHNNTIVNGLQNLLRFADRNSMAHSIEVRLPFLSHNLVNFLFTIPSTFKIHNGWTKWLLRKSFDDLLPHSIAWRTDKIGYEPPQQDWMNNPEIKNRIMASREKLVKENILHKNILSKTIKSEAASEFKEKTWQHWMAALLFN